MRQYSQVSKLPCVESTIRKKLQRHKNVAFKYELKDSHIFEVKEQDKNDDIM